MRTRPYTERQLKIINGEISADTVNGNEISRIVRKAKELGDCDVVNKYSQILEERAEAYRIRNNERVKHTYHTIAKYREGLAQPKVSTSKYSERQQQIVNGEIPYEQVATRELLLIASKARLNEDYELLSLMEMLAEEKHADALDRNRRSAYERKYRIRGMEPPPHEPVPTGHRENRDWAIDILESRENPDLYSDKRLRELYHFAEQLDDERYLRIAVFLNEERKDRSIVYVVETKKEACELVEYHTVFPIRWPEEWFKEEEKPGDAG